VSPFDGRRASRPVALLAALTAAVVLGGCTLTASGTASSPQVIAVTPQPSATGPASPTARPDWLDIELTEVTTGETLTVGGFPGKVVLLEAMATWCPTCRQQGNEVKKLHQALGAASDQVVSVSLDVDPNEDAPTLVKYAAGSSFDWRFAIAPKQLGRELADLYGPNYLNPPYAPMLIVDRNGGIYPLPDYLKTADSLQKALASYLAG
jgi:cytochrome oxidase Cu insertion factor (SCO1/SenC/PrrC family)